MIEEGPEVSLEARLAHNLFHLFRDTFYFPLTQLKDLVGGHVGSRVVFDEKLIILPAIWNFADASCFTTCRQIFLLDEVGKTLMRWNDLLTDYPFIGLREPLLVFLRKRLRHFLDRCIEEVVCNGTMIEIAKLRYHLPCKHLGKYISFRHTFAHVHDGSITPLDVVVQTGEPVFIILHRFERLEACAARELADEE